MTFLLITAIAIWIIDNTRIIEDYNPKVVEIAKSIDGDNLKGGVYAYDLEKHEDKIVQTLYFAYDRTKSIVTFHLKDGVIDSAYRETHYTTKLSAKRCEDAFISKTIDSNIVYGPIDLGDVFPNDRKPRFNWTGTVNKANNTATGAALTKEKSSGILMISLISLSSMFVLATSVITNPSFSLVISGYMPKPETANHTSFSCLMSLTYFISTLSLSCIISVATGFPCVM